MFLALINEGLVKLCKELSMSKILVVDDDLDLTKVVKLFLESHSYEVIVAHEGLRAIECAHRQQPDLILLDLKIPVGKGGDVLKALQAKPETDQIPVLILTGLDMDELEKTRLLKQGAKQILMKPYQEIELLSAIQAHLKSL